jgi:hypothetical protein
MKYIALLICITFFISCSKVYDCGKVYLNPVFIGFQQRELEPILIRQLDTRGNLIGEIYYSNPASFTVKGDSIEVDITAPYYKLSENYVWQLVLLNQNKTTIISEIVEEQKTGKCFSKETSNCHCDNAIVSYKKNGQLFTVPAYSKPLCYIKK